MQVIHQRRLYSRTSAARQGQEARCEDHMLNEVLDVDVE